MSKPRKMILSALVAWGLLILWGWSTAADPRYTNLPIARDPDGAIHRSGAVIAAFRRDHPCPATGSTTGACPGWQVDHVIPLVCNGADVEWNMQWLPWQIKAASGVWPKDRWEQRVYCRPAAPAAAASAP